jgi:hypothetical protein
MRGDKAELAKRQAEDDIITKEAADQKVKAARIARVASDDERPAHRARG